MRFQLIAAAAVLGVCVGGAAFAEEAKAPAKTLKERFEEFKAGFSGKVPEAAKKTMKEGVDAVRASGQLDRLPKVGQPAPALKLPDATGKTVEVAELAKSGPVVIVWYRGQWCPYCNLELAAYRERLAEFRAAGAAVVAVSPQTPDNTLSTAEKAKLEFPVLSDAGNKAAREWGLVFKLGADLLEVYKGFGLDLSKFNGDSAKDELPLAATFVVGSDGKIAFVHADADYTVRAEPADVLAVVKKLTGK
jgi:peroxiredoxin